MYSNFKQRIQIKYSLILAKGKKPEQQTILEGEARGISSENLTCGRTSWGREELVRPGVGEERPRGLERQVGNPCGGNEEYYDTPVLCLEAEV